VVNTVWLLLLLVLTAKVVNILTIIKLVLHTTVVVMIVLQVLIALIHLPKQHVLPENTLLVAQLFVQVVKQAHLLLLQAQQRVQFVEKDTSRMKLERPYAMQLDLAHILPPQGLLWLPSVQLASTLVMLPTLDVLPVPLVRSLLQALNLVLRVLLVNMPQVLLYVQLVQQANIRISKQPLVLRVLLVNMPRQLVQSVASTVLVDLILAVVLLHVLIVLQDRIVKKVVEHILSAHLVNLLPLSLLHVVTVLQDYIPLRRDSPSVPVV
jgi:hypothetical protein